MFHPDGHGMELARWTTLMATEAIAPTKARGAGAERRLNWAVMVLALVMVAGCLSGIGVGKNAMMSLFLALVAMSCISLLIAWLFLRKRTSAESPSSGAKLSTSSRD
jgi:hypothetical protein